MRLRIPDPPRQPQMPAEDIAIIFNLGLRQALFVEAYLGPCKYNPTCAALKAGYSSKHPRQSAHQIRKSLKVRYAIDTLFRYYLGRMFSSPQ
jgi:hypothetical protein